MVMVDFFCVSFFPFFLCLVMNIAQVLLEKNAVRVSLDPPFRWTSGIESPVYCDNRLMTGYVGEREVIVRGFVEKIHEMNWKPTVIAGTATAAISWAAFVAAEMKLPMVYIRPEPKKHGAKKQIEGYMEPGSEVLIVEDLFSTGGSSIKSATEIRNEGKSEVVGAISIMTWELPVAEKNFEEAGVEHVSLTGFSQIIPLAAEKGYISADDVAKILEFRSDPSTWSERLASTA